MATSMSVSAIRAAAAMTGQPPSPPHASSKNSPRRTPTLPLSPATAVSAVATGATAFLAVTPAPAHAVAFSKEEIASSLTKVEETIDQVGDVGGKALELSVNVFKALSEAVKPALPVLRSAGEEALKIASPVVSDASKQAKEALQGAGVDPSPVLSAAKTVADAAQQTTKVIDVAKPIASATVETIASSEPSAIAVAAGAAFLAYVLVSPVWSLVSFSFRGYKGNLSPAQSLDMVTSRNYVLVDIRTEKEKGKAGVPQLPSNAKNKLISVPLEDLPSKIKGLVRSAKQVEAEIAALKISFLKMVNKGSNIVIMDSYSDVSKTVARTLTSIGFKNCWIMAGGFFGRNGWSQSRLGTDSYNLALVEVVSPSRTIPAAAARFGTTSSAPQPPRKLLPGCSTNRASSPSSSPFGI